MQSRVIIGLQAHQHCGGACRQAFKWACCDKWAGCKRNEWAYQTVLGPGYTTHSGPHTHADHIDHRPAGLQPCRGAYRHMCRPTNIAEVHTDMYSSKPAETYSEQGKDTSRTTFPALKQAYNSRAGLLNNTGVRVYHMCRPTDIYEPGWDHGRAVGPQNLWRHILTHA